MPDPVQDFIIAQNIKQIKEAIAGKKILKKSKLPAHPIAIENNYVVQLRGIVDIGKKLYNEAIHDNSVLNEILRVDAESDIINSVFNSLKTSWATSTEKVALIASDIGQKVSEWNDNKWRKIMKNVVGIDIFTSEPWLKDVVSSFAKENTNLIITLQNDTINDIEGIVQRAYRAGGRVEGVRASILQQIQRPGAYRPEKAIQELVKKRWKTAKSHAELIARDQVSKLNGQLTQRRQMNIGVTRYEWAISRDQRVRKTHRVMDRIICDWNDPTIYYSNNEIRKRSSIGGVELHPGYDYQCRCVALAYFQDFVDQEKGVV